jgi:alkanesulfonate monooxygenase SsuD/methylene tetrahydromethanopterin reductase-like flavin-dependent oxidoreductase (luciferase family)
VGVGAFRSEFDVVGAPFGEKGARADEGIEVMRRLWAGRPVTFRGRFFTLKEARLDPPPVQQPPPIWVGGRSPGALRRAARYGDGWLDNSPFATPREFGLRLARIRELSGRYSGSSRSVEAGVFLYVNLDDEVGRAEAGAAAHLSHLYGPVDGSPTRPVREVGAFGSRSVVVKRIEEHADQGAEMVCLCPATRDPVGQMERCVAEVLPSF